MICKFAIKHFDNKSCPIVISWATPELLRIHSELLDPSRLLHHFENALALDFEIVVKPLLYLGGGVDCPNGSKEVEIHNTHHVRKQTFNEQQ